MTSDKLTIPSLRLGSAAGALAMLLANGSAQALDFDFSDLGTVDGPYAGWGMSVSGINNLGLIVGGDGLTPYVWNNGVATALDTPVGSDGTSATAINDVGQVVGGDYTVATDRGYPFRWDGTSFTQLGTLDGYISSALAINNVGLMAGGSWGGSAFQPVRWNGAVITQLDTLGGAKGTAGGINEAGLIVGESNIVNDEGHHATLWASGTAATDLGTAGGVNSTAIDINNHNQIVGWGGLPGDEQTAALLWDGLAAAPSVLSSLGGNDSAAQAINDQGWIVGWSTLAPTDDTAHAVLWQGNGTPLDLNAYLPSAYSTQGWYLSYAMGVNEAGTIVGLLSNANDPNLTASFELKAVPVPVPVPAAVWLFGSALAGLIGFGRRKA